MSVGIKLIVELDADMDREDAAMVALDLGEIEGVAEVTDMNGLPLDGE